MAGERSVLGGSGPGDEATGTEIYSTYGSEMPPPSQALWEGAMLETDLRT